MAAAPCAQAAPANVDGATLAPVRFDAISGWRDDHHELAFAAFLKGCAAPPPLRTALPEPAGLRAACEAALAAPAPDRDAARRFFERWFVPLRIVPSAAARRGQGFLTGYFEPAFPGSLNRQEGFTTPLYGRPADLVTLGQGELLPSTTPLQAARRLPDGTLGPYATRHEIEESDVARDWPVIAWVRDPVDRFIMQVQGSARLSLPEGGSARIAYAGRNGHPYVSLGRLLSQTESIPPADMTMDRLVARLKGDPEWSRRFIWNNPSFVFFRIASELDPAAGPIGGAGMSLTPHRSVAADRTIWSYGLPLWLDGVLPLAERGRTGPLQRLTIIQDTGSAIVGAARFDLFYGTGEEAGFIAGLTRHDVAATVLWPRPGGPDAAVR